MKTKDSLSAALKLVLQKNWLHREECLDKLQQFVEPEINHLLTEAHRRREQEAAHTVEPFGAAVAAVLVETLCAYMVEQARYWTDDEKVRRQLAALLVLRQYLSADDRNMPRKKVLKYLQNETYLCETWGLTTTEAHTIGTAIENISPNNLITQKHRQSRPDSIILIKHINPLIEIRGRIKLTEKFSSRNDGFAETRPQTS